MLNRNSRPTNGSSSSIGGRPRPSRKWHDEQERALNSGPSPSLHSVDEGDVTQRRLNRALPTKKSVRCSSGRLRAGWPKALLVALKTVVWPPESGSPPCGDGVAVGLALGTLLAVWVALA